MVSSVSSTPYYSYLSQLQGGQNTNPTVPKPPVTPPANNAGDPTSASLVSSLLGNGGYAPTVLSLLQENGSGAFDPIASLLNGPRTDSGIVKLYANVYNSSSASTLQQAKLDNPKPKASVPFSVQNLIDSSSKASVAYNQTIQQNAAAAVAASKVRTDGITSLVS